MINLNRVLFEMKALVHEYGEAHTVNPVEAQIKGNDKDMVNIIVARLVSPEIAAELGSEPLPTALDGTSIWGESGTATREHVNLLRGAFQRPAIVALGIAQELQDEGEPWGSVYKAAKSFRKMLNS